MPQNHNGNGECCEVPICLIITDVTITSQAKDKMKELFENLCGGDDNGNDD